MDCNTAFFSVLHYLPEFALTHVHRVSDAIQPSHSLLPPSPPALNLSQHQGLFQWVGSYQVAKVLSFSINSSYAYSGLISFRMYWLDLLAVQGTLQSLLQHHKLKASVLPPPAFFTVQLFHPYMSTGKTIALTVRTFVRTVNTDGFPNYVYGWLHVWPVRAIWCCQVLPREDCLLLLRACVQWALCAWLCERWDFFLFSHSFAGLCARHRTFWFIIVYSIVKLVSLSSTVVESFLS